MVLPAGVSGQITVVESGDGDPYKTLTIGLDQAFIDSIPDTWIELTDTPSTITASKFVKSNSGGTALEFVDNPHANTSFVSLTDTPGTFTADQYVKVNSAGTALEYVDETAINTSIAVTAAKKALIYAIIFGG